MITPDVVGRIDPVFLVEPADEREARKRRAGVMLIAVTLGDRYAAASWLSAAG
jgi:hypothetical protein